MTTAIINRKRYNTATATLVATWTNGLSSSDFKHCDEDLYVTVKGAWFTCGSGGPMSRYGRAVIGGMMTGSRDAIRPITRDEARLWLEQYSDAKTIEKYFANDMSQRLR